MKFSEEDGEQEGPQFQTGSSTPFSERRRHLLPSRLLQHGQMPLCAAHSDSAMVKKDSTIGVRVDDELLRVLERLAEEEDRPLAAMARKLVVEALHKLGLLAGRKSR